MRLMAMSLSVTSLVPLAVRAASASTAPITLSGRVSCTSSNVEGVWLEVGTGNSNWANMGNVANTVRSTTWSRTFTPISLPTNIRLHVGCGGSPSSWWSDNRTPSSYRTIGSITGSAAGLNAKCDEGWSLWGANNAKPPAGENVRCSWGRRGLDANGYPYTNATCARPLVNGLCQNYDWVINGSDKDYTLSPHWWFVYRNCTDYVAYREFFRNLSKAVFTGNAAQWASEADGTNGWVKAKTPTPGDIAWWGGGQGHVAVVTTVLSNGMVAVEEFNYPGGAGADHVRVGVAATYLHRT
jgi:surface antigen